MFNEKLKKIIDDIYSKKIYSVNNIKLTLEEFLTKDENGITFIEHLLKNKIDLDFTQEKLFENNIEIIYLYNKYDQNLYCFNISEGILFSTIHGDLLINHIIKKDNLSSKIIKNIKNDLRILELTKDIPETYYYLSYLSPEIVKKLMDKDNEENYMIEKYLDNENLVKFIIPLIDNFEIVNICNKHNKPELLKYIHENILMKNIDNKTILEEFLEKNIIPEKILNIPENQKFIKFLCQKNLYEYLKNSKEQILLYKINPTKTLLEEIIEKGYIPKSTTIFEKETIKILYKLKKLDIAESVAEPLLLLPVKEYFKNFKYRRKPLINYMLDNNINPLKNSYSITKDEIIKVLYKQKRYDILAQKISAQKMLFQVEENTTILDILLENNMKINLSYPARESLEIAKVIFAHDRLDLLCKFNLNILMTPINIDNTFMDYLLEAIKNKKVRFNINSIYTRRENILTIAKFYLCVAKHDMAYYLKELDEKKLLKIKDNKQLLSLLLQLDKELTINKLLTDKVKSKPKIAFILKNHGIDQPNIDIIKKPSLYLKDDIRKDYNSSGIGPLLNEGQILIEKLSELFKNDGKSDAMLVDSLTSSYRRALLLNYDNTLNELKKLVAAKEKHYDNFFYLSNNGRAYFSTADNSVHCRIPVISTTAHETGHALHNFLADGETPEKYDQIIKKIRNNPEILKKIKVFAKAYKDKKEEIENIAEKKAKEHFANYYTPQKLEEIENFLNSQKFEKRIEFESLNIPDDKLDALINEYFTIEHYINHERRLYIEEFIELYIEKYSSYFALADILDAIYEGELHNGVLKDLEGKLIEPTAGHGIAYYYESSHGFDEMIANYSTIMKSYDSEVIIKYLIDIVGNELYELLNDFYLKNFVLNKDDNEEPKKI